MDRKEYIKWTAVFLLVAVLNLVLFQIFFYNRITEAGERENENNINRLSAVADNISAKFEKINLIGVEIIGNADVRLLTLYRNKMSDRGLTDVLIEINRLIADNEQRCSYIQNIALMIFNDGQRSYFGNYDSGFAKKLERLQKQEDLFSDGFQVVGGDLFLTKRFSSHRGGNNAAVIIRISAEDIIRDINPITLPKEECVSLENPEIAYSLFVGSREIANSEERISQNIGHTGFSISKYYDKDEYFNIIRRIEVLNVFSIFMFLLMIVIYTYTARAAYKKAILAQTAQLRQYQSQIDPHFLYNSFYTQIRMIKADDYETLQDFTQYLGDYFKFLHSGDDNDSVRLEEELMNAQAYSRIQQIRFKRRISVEFNWLEEGDKGRVYLNKTVPRLIVQPIIENAFAHSLEKMESGGRLRISMSASDGVFMVVVEDNGVIDDSVIKRCADKLTEKENAERYSAIANIDKRLKLTFSKKSGLSFSRSGLGGLSATIRIDFS